MMSHAILDPLEKLRETADACPELVLAILVGSRAQGRTGPNSDWDIAVQWMRDMDWLITLGHTETLRRQFAQALGVEETQIDLIDLPRANLAMRASVADEGVPLKGENTLAWAHFLRRTWRDLEEFYWDQCYGS